MSSGDSPTREGCESPDWGYVLVTEAADRSEPSAIDHVWKELPEWSSKIKSRLASERGFHPDRAPGRHRDPRHPRRDRRSVVPQLPRQRADCGSEVERPLGDPGGRAFYQNQNPVTYSGLNNAALKVVAPGISPNVLAAANTAGDGYCLADSEDGGNNYSWYTSGNGGTSVVSYGTKAAMEGVCKTAYTGTGGDAFP